MDVFHPVTLDEALMLSGPTEDPTFVGGATLIQLGWALGLPRPHRLIDLGGIAGLRGIARTGSEVRIGATTTLAALEADCKLADELPMLNSAVRSIAAPTIRNIGTIGGNVGGRKGCLIPALLALDAELDIVRPGLRQRVSLFNWLMTDRNPSCIIEAIVVPLSPPPAMSTYRKIGLRAAFTPGVIGVAGRIEVADGRIVLARLAVGSGPVVPMRFPEVEALLVGEAPAAVDWARVHAALVENIRGPEDAARSIRYRRLAAANALVDGLGGTIPLRSMARSRWMPREAEPLADEVKLGRASAGADWHIRPDEQAKVEGRFAYLTDKRQPDMLVGRILRAGIPHARILAIDTSEAERLPGVAAVVTHRDITGSNGFGIVIQDQPALCHDKVRYAGDAVAAVAAIDAKVAAEALSLIKVTYEPLPLVSEPEAALAADAVRVHETGNLQRELSLDRGDTVSAFASAAHVVEATYETPRQMHAFMETEGGYAFVADDGTLTVCAGGQHGRRDQMQLARILAMPEDRIRVVSSPTGGAFGGKDELTVQPALALLALKTGRAVRLQLDRAESVMAGTKVTPMRIRMRTACDAEGRLLAQEVDLLADAGAYASLSPGVVETALEHACGPYVVPNVRSRARLAYTNNGTCGAMRGFGCNQMSYAVECQMDRLAEASGLDPIAMRERNLRRQRTPGYLGQTVAPTERLGEMLAAAAADPIWRRPRGVSADGAEFIGVGMGMNFQGNGLGTLPPDPGGGVLRLAPDGAIEALLGMDEIGQGLLAAIRNSVAAELGCGLDDVRPVTGDTGATPESGSTTASRGTYVVWRVARDAAPRLSEKLRAAGARLLGRTADSLKIVPGGLAEAGSNSGDVLIGFGDIARALDLRDLPAAECSFEFPKSDYFAGNARLIFAFGATLARVAVDRVTGQVRVLELSQHTAAGPILDHASYLGQIEGGSMQGVGFTLSEHAALQDGLYVTENLDSYMIPSIQDSPRSMSIHALQTLEPDDRFGPRGVGELGIGAVAPAIANAVADATGYWPGRAPIDPESVLDWLAAS